MTTKNLEAAIEIEAAPERVWSVVSDLRRMPEWSGQCRVMLPLGAVRKGAHTLNVNRRGWMYWPTASRVERFEPNRVIAFRTLTNGSVWSFELTPAADGATTVTHRRTCPPEGTAWMSRTVVEHVLGGEDNFDVEMEQGMRATLTKIKATVEQRPAPADVKE